MGGPGPVACFAIYLFYTCSQIVAFNLDTKVPIVKIAPPNSYFGFSVAQHQKSHSHVFLVGAPKGNITDRDELSEVRNIYQPGIVYSCPLTSLTDDCETIKIDRHAPTPEEGRDDMWLGVTVRSQRTATGKALACAHRFKKVGASSRWGRGMCITMTNDLDMDSYFDPCAAKPTNKGHGQYGFCQAGTSADMSAEDLILGVPGPVNWRGAIFKNIVRNDLTLATFPKWYQSAVEDPLPTVPGPEPVVGFYSYLGMSARIGTVLNGKKTYIGGAPRSLDLGQVLLFEPAVNDDDDMLHITPDHYLTGDQFGACFGYDIALVDFNSDGRQDLVVGAPFYLAPRVGGAFYVFMNGPEGITSSTKNMTIKSRPMTIAECNELDCTSARFGFSLANIGDLDQDGYEDLAVGAPYEGNGAVYIFRGSQDGIIPEFAQRIVASDLPMARPLTTFGYSLSGGLDMDNNGYPDIVVGAFDSSKTIVLRSRPVINVQSMTQFTPDLIDPSVTTCGLDGRESNCFKVRLCFKFTAKPEDRFTSSLDLTYVLEAEKFTGKKLSRVFIKGALRQSNHMIERTITMNKQSNSQLRCKEHVVYIISNNKDFLHPIQFQLTYKLKAVAPPTMSPGSSLPDMNTYPVLNDAAAIIKRSVDFKKNCGANDICESDIDIRGILPLKQDRDGQYILKVGQQRELKLEVSVKNHGEDAHEATLYIDLPESLSYTGVTQKKYACIPTKSNVTCSIANPMSTNQRATFEIRLDATNIIASKHSLKIGLRVNTTSTEINERNNYDELVIKVVVETDLLVRGYAAEPVEVFYGGEVKGESAIKYEDEIGSAVTHSYEVKNKGPGRVLNVTVFISWPYEVESGYSRGKHLLYLMQAPEIIGNRGAFAGKCYMEPGMVNPLRIKTVPKPLAVHPSDGNTNYTVLNEPKKKRRSKREAIIPAEEFIDSSGRSLSVVIMDCDRKTAKCFTFPCVLGEIRKGESIVISMRSRLWNSTFVEDYTHVDHVRIFSKAEIKIDPSLSVKQTDTKNDISKAMTRAIPDIEVAEREGVPLWIIILAVIGGLLLLILLILLLWKCGFFRRQKADEMRKYRGKLEKKKYYDDDYN